jgi:hypothetical protein
MEAFTRIPALEQRLAAGGMLHARTRGDALDFLGRDLLEEREIAQESADFDVAFHVPVVKLA